MFRVNVRVKFLDYGSATVASGCYETCTGITMNGMLLRKNLRCNAVNIDRAIAHANTGRWGNAILSSLTKGITRSSTRTLRERLNGWQRNR